MNDPVKTTLNGSSPICPAEAFERLREGVRVIVERGELLDGDDLSTDDVAAYGEALHKVDTAFPLLTERGVLDDIQAFLDAQYGRVG